MFSPSIAIIGLGYVGLLLALALFSYYSVTEYDTDAAWFKEFRDGHDRTGEVEAPWAAT